MLRKPRNILYIGRFGLPDTAAGLRVFNNAKILASLGCKVHCLCARYNEQQRVDVEDVEYHFVYRTSSGCLSSLGNVFELIFAGRMFQEVKRTVEAHSIDTIILYNELFALTCRLVGWCRRHDIRLVSDVTEWYEQPDASAQIIDKVIPYLTDKRIRLLDAKVHNIIAISPYLSGYYRAKGCNVMFMPPVFDAKLMAAAPMSGSKPKAVLRLVYTGAPGANNKDVIEPLLRAVSRVNGDGVKVEFHIVGLAERDLGRYVEFDDFAQRGILAYGRVAHERVLDIVRSADFGVLLRRPLRYAKAGFSTKLAETMMLGVPMLCNRVGGAEMLLEDRIDGYLVDTADESALIAALEQLCGMPNEALCEMKQAARRKAMELFSLQNYVESMRQFLQ